MVTKTTTHATSSKKVKKAPSMYRRHLEVKLKRQIAFRYRENDTQGGVTRQTARRLAAALGMDETQVIHRALREMAMKVLPNYEQDDGPLTVRQLRDIDRLVPQGTKHSVRSSLFELDRT